MIVFRETSECLGYLFTYTGKVFDTHMGRIAVTPEQAETHNRLLDDAAVKKFKSFAIGQGGNFYFSHDRKTIRTFLGTYVATRIPGRRLFYARHDMVFKVMRYSHTFLTVFCTRVSLPKKVKVRNTDAPNIRALS